MPGRNGASGAWNPVELSLFTNDWPPIEKAVMLAMVVLSPNPYGVYSVASWQVLGIVQALQCISSEIAGTIMSALKDALGEDYQSITNALPIDYQSITNTITNALPIPLPISKIEKALESLVEKGSINKYPGNVYWVKDRWSYTGITLNSKHQKGALAYIKPHFPEVWKDFSEWYKIPAGLPIDYQSITNGIGNALSKGKGKYKKNTVVAPKTREKPEKTSARNQHFIQLRNRLEQIISLAEDKHNISKAAKNNTDEALDALRQIVDTDKVKEADIEPIVRHHFLINDEEIVQFSLKTRRHIARWRKKWKGADNAFDAMRHAWELAGKPQPGKQGGKTSSDIQLGS